MTVLQSGGGEVRFSADHSETVPFWDRWVPALVGIGLIRLIPLRSDPIAAPGPPAGSVAASRPPARPRRVRLTVALILLATAVLFAVALRLAGGGEPAHTLLKLPLLLGVPAMLFWLVGRPDNGHLGVTGSWRGWEPVIPVTAWLILAYTGPFAAPGGDLPDGTGIVSLLAILVVGFAVNALVEEVFCRRWLQTRWEALLGVWPGIVLASLLWAVWHIGIQGTGVLTDDLASVVTGLAVQGLFLGYLWSRYRRMWPILTVHGAMNAAPLILTLL